MQSDRWQVGVRSLLPFGRFSKGPLEISAGHRIDAMDRRFFAERRGKKESHCFMEQFQELCELLVDLCQRLRSDVSDVLSEVGKVLSEQKAAKESATFAAEQLIAIAKAVLEEEDEDYDPDLEAMELSDSDDEKFDDSQE